MTTDVPNQPIRIAAIIPVGTLEGAKSRLGATLDAEERQDLAESLLDRTLAAALAAPSLVDVLVVSPDREILRLAADRGARTLRQRSGGLNEGLQAARVDVVAGGAEAVMVLPIDLAFVGPVAIEAVLEPIRAGLPGPVVVVVGDRHGTGTNALALRPPDIIDFAFGPDSRATHRAAAARAGARCVELDGPLVFDIDTPADLVLAETLASEEIGAR